MHTKNNKNSNQQNYSQTDQAREPETLDELFNLCNLGLEDEAWQKIVKALAARGFPIKEEDLQFGKQ
jgi:hypothetical protein